MSLETKIEELTQAINLLRETILMDVRGELSPSDPNPTIEQKTLTPVEDLNLPKDKPEQIDFDDFKAKCLDFARDPKVGKIKVKEVLKDFGAAKASDVAEDDRAKVIKALGAL